MKCSFWECGIARIVNHECTMVVVVVVVVGATDDDNDRDRLCCCKHYISFPCINISASLLNVLASLNMCSFRAATRSIKFAI
jgi:hypothetical protein